MRAIPGLARRLGEHRPHGTVVGAWVPGGPRSAMQMVRFIILPVLALAMTACSEPTPTPSPTPAPPTPTATPMPTPTIFGGPHPTYTPTPAGFSLTVDSSTTWGEALDAFTPAEQDCIRGAVDEATLRRALDERLFSEGDAEDWERSIFLCVAPQTARALFLSIRIAEVEEEGVEVSGEEEACLRDWVAGLGIGVLAAGDDDPAVGQAISGMIACIPDAFVDIMIQAVAAEAGVDLMPTEEEKGLPPGLADRCGLCRPDRGRLRLKHTLRHVRVHPRVARGHPGPSHGGGQRDSDHAECRREGLPWGASGRHRHGCPG